MRRLSEASLFNSALFYLRRYSATVAQLRRVLHRKAKRTAAKEGLTDMPVDTFVEAVLLRLQLAGYLNDERVASSRAEALRRSGKSTKAIAFKLKQTGVDQKWVAQWVSAHASDEAQAAWTWARKKRLGPFRSEDKRALFRQKDFAALVRAGFSFSLAKEVIEAKAPMGPMSPMSDGETLE